MKMMSCDRQSSIVDVCEQLCHGKAGSVDQQSPEAVDVQSDALRMSILARYLTSARLPLVLSAIKRPTLTLLMPSHQSTLSFDSPTRQLSISPQKPKPSHLTISNKGQQPDLRRLHHEEEDMAAASKSRAKAQAEGKSVPMHDEEGGEVVDAEAGDGPGGKGASEVKGKRGKGIPTNNKRSRSPDGTGGVAGRDSKKSKNAYEISELAFHISDCQPRHLECADASV